MDYNNQGEDVLCPAYLGPFLQVSGAKALFSVASGAILP